MLHHYSLRQRFRAVLSGTLLLLPQVTTNLSDLIEAAILDRTRVSQEPVSRTVNAIITGLWQHHDLNALSRYLKRLDDQIVALLIALACRDALSPKTAITAISNFLNDSFRWNSELQAEISLFKQQLNLVRTLIEQGASGAIAQMTLKTPNQKDDDWSIAYGLYCWLSTPHNWQLAVSRAQQINPETGIAIAAIAAAYSGRLPTSDAITIKADTIKAATDLGDQLLAAWSGVSNWKQLAPDFYATITAPDILGKRS